MHPLLKKILYPPLRFMSLISVVDPDLQIRGGGGGGLKKTFFGPSGLILI